jgi:2-succinyl-5-enolpyruvyl-6-hydroxy-3-cyclohexene-1-carboxylate synthase
MAADIWGHGSLQAPARGVKHSPPAVLSVGESVKQDQAHPPIMPAVDSHLLLRAIVDEFARCGVEHAAICPGSRNTPIVQALVTDERIRCWSHIDERCAGFFALGAAKASGRPAIVTCTSGTAGANLLPAVVEAHEAGVPLIVLTADRPPELRGIGAGQAIDQLKLFGDAAKWFVELGVDQATVDTLRWVRSLACRAFITASEDRPGAVHLNIPLREPLVVDQALPPEPGGGGRSGGGPWVTSLRPESVPRAPRTHRFDGVVLVAGELGPDSSLGARLAAFAARAGVPLLADPQSGARSGPAAIAHYDLILRQEQPALTPQVVCRIGELPTSKPLRNWIASLTDAHHVTFAANSGWSDPSSQVLQRSVGSLAELFDRLETDEVVSADPSWLAAWRTVDDAVAQAISTPLADSGLSEPALAALLGSTLPTDATLVVASSMPIRDVEEFFPVSDAPPRVLANRGANGIDGTVSTAFGVATTTDRPVVLLIGDVTLAHDIGGLLTARRTGLRLTIVLINNDGGGIFHFLPIAAEEDVFEQHVATPHGLEFEHAAALYGCGYQLATDVADFHAAFARAIASGTTEIIEVRTDRAENRELHAVIAAAAAG